MSSPACPKTIALRLGLDVKEVHKSCDETLLPSLANFVHPWREVFAYLLAPIDLDDIDNENVGRSEQTKRLASLWKWKIKCGARATYGELITSLLKNGDVQNAENICQQLLEKRGENGASPHERLGLPHSDQPRTSSPSPLSTVEEPSYGLEVQIDRLDQQYIEIETLVLRTIKNREIPLDEVLDWVRFPPTKLRTQFAEVLRQQARVISSATSIDELFSFLSSYWNLFHPALLQHLVNKLGDEDLKARMDCYMDDLYHFRIQTTLGDFLDKWIGKIPPGYKEFILEVGEEWRERTIEDFEQFRIRLSRLQDFGGGHMSYLKAVKSSSILIVLALPAQLFPLNFSQKDMHTFIKDENIVRVMVDGECVINMKNLIYERIDLITSNQSNCFSAMEMLTISNVIRESYLARQKNRDLQWPPCFAEKLVRLELHQEVYDVYYNKQQRGGHKHYSTSSREQLEYDDIFKNTPGGRVVKKLLVEGDAGIGKTTLCTSISIDWAQHKRLRQFDLVLLLPLREKVVTSVNSVIELLHLFHPSKEICKSVADTFLQGAKGKRVLIIADGWDELDPSQQKSGSFIYKLLFQDAIYSATIMITSRPSASVALHKNPYVDRFIEIAGFDKKGIVQYIKSEFAEECEKVSRDGLLQQLKENALLRSICHVPINCAIICHMWRSDESLPLDMTMTDIYTKIILHFMLLNFQKFFPQYGLESLNSFDAIPEDMQECLSLLCKFAYDALAEDTYVFSYDKLKTIFPEAAAVEDQQGDQQLFTFGLMQSAQAFEGIGRGASFHFLHRTFQEYMSAFHIALQPSQNQIRLMKPCAYTSRIAIAMRFVIGLGTSGAQISSRIRPLTCNSVCEVYEIDNRVRVSCVGWTNGMVVHGIHEAKEGVIKNYLLKLLYGDYFTFAFPRTAHDCATVVKAIEQFPRAMKISYRDEARVSLKFEHCSLDEELLTNLAVALFKTEGRLHIKTLLIQDNNELSDAPISMLMNLAAPALQSLKQLSLAANSLGAESITSIADYLMKSSIERLTLSYNPLGAAGALALQNAMMQGTFFKLSDLQLKNCSLSNSEACVSLFQVLPNHCANLKQLDISENNIENPTIVGESLGKLLQMHTNLSELHMNKTKFGYEGMKALTNFLSTGNNLTHISVLSLKENDIHPEGIILLVKCIKSEHLFVSDCLNVDGNSIGLKGSVSLASVLNTKSVSMSNCQVTVCTEDTKEQLKDELSKLPQIEVRKELILDNNCFTREDTDILIHFVRMCPRLNSLSCADCQIDSKDLKKLIDNEDFTHSLAELETWSLQNNKLDDTGCGLLVRFVNSHLPKVTGIFIYGNNTMNRNLFQLLEQEVAKHRPKGDVFERVLTAVAPGVPYDKLRVIVEKHNAYEELTDEEQDPVLLWDEYCRRGEEQRQQAEAIMGWTMSFQDDKLSEELITNAQQTFSTKIQMIGADFMSAFRSRERLEYSKQDHTDEDNEDDMEDDGENLGADVVSKEEPVSFPDIELPGGKVIPSSIVSSLTAQFLGTSNITPEIITNVTQFAQGPFGQMILNQLLQFQGAMDIDYNAIDSTTILRPENLTDVRKEVWDLSPVYYSLGVELGICSSDLDKIKAENSKVDQALTEVLNLWLRKGYPTSSTTPPTWQSLVKAVANPSGGNNRELARDIASRHCPPMEI